MGGGNCRLAERCARERFELRLAESALCMDNAAVVGLLAEQKLARGQGIADLDAEPALRWVMAWHKGLLATSCNGPEGASGFESGPIEFTVAFVDRKSELPTVGRQRVRRNGYPLGQVA